MTTFPAPTIRRQRHETRRRALTITAVERITPAMLRITAKGDDLAGFISASPDDHLKLFVPAADGSTAMRDYTPRRHDPIAGTLVVEVVDHPGGPAADWARTAAVGDTLAIGGPRGSQVIDHAGPAWLLIGDESALPAIARRVEELPAGTRATVIAAVTGPAEQQQWASAAEVTTHWIHRPTSAAADPAPVLAALAAVDLGDTASGACFAWVAAEAGVARAVRQHLLGPGGFAKEWVKAAGYWIAGEADASVKSLDEEG